MPEKEKGLGKNGRSIFALILLAGTAARVMGINAGLPFIVHPDETRQILDALGMAQRHSLLPEDFSYPAMHKYMILAVNGAYYLAGRVLGLFASPEDFALKFLEGNSHVFLLSRLLSAAAGILTGLAVFRICARFYSRRAAFTGFAFSMFMFQLIQHSQWAISDIFLALFSTASVYYLILSIEAPAESKYITRALLFTGLAISTKPQGLFLLAPLMASQFFVLKDMDFRVSEFLKGKAPGIIVFFAAAAAGNLSWIFEFRASYEKFIMLSQVARIGISSRAPFTAGAGPLAVWFAKELMRQEGPLGAVLIAGVIYAAVRHTRRDLIFMTYMAVFIFTVRDWAIRYLHLFVALFPIMCVFGARLADEFLSRLRVKGTFVPLLIAATVAPSFYGSIEASVIKSRTDTRMLAKEWVEANIPEGTAVAMDWYEFAIPLLSATPAILSNPKARTYFEKSAPAKLRASYGDFLKDKKSYRTLPVVYTTKAPNWPPGMGGSAVKKATEKEVYRELYSVFNFHSVPELKRMGARYLVISSYSYTNFLLDDDQDKSPDAVFNYLFKEDLLSFNKQSDSYVDDGRFGLLFYLNKRARDFYTPLLKGTSGCALVKEFRPNGIPGPVIKIFRL